MPHRLLIATTNPGKVREVAGVLEGLEGWELLSLKDLPGAGEIPETGDTFEANAVAKAVGYGKAHGGLALADDSGICVDALDGAPGVQSARFGGPGLDDPGRVRHLLRRMENVTDGKRTARFVCVLALARGGRLVRTFRGVAEGRLLREPRGRSGFGYDPIFFHEPSGRTFAELTREEKSLVSHRGRALLDLRRWLEIHPDKWAYEETES